jgi:outer membrane protein OmpA-like peptidoglycan-associated protein
MRRALLGIAALSAFAGAAAAQTPVFSVPLDRPQSSETYRRLPFRDMGNEIRIEVNADLLYSFDDAKVRLSASDLLAQAANLIYERAKSPVRIECRSDRVPAAAAQKLADACAAALLQYLVKEEKVTNVKFSSVGVSVPPPAPRSVRAAAAAADQGGDRVWEEVRTYVRVCSKILSPCRSMIWRALFTVNVTASS